MTEELVGDPRFFASAGPRPVDVVARACGAQIHGGRLAGGVGGSGWEGSGAGTAELMLQGVAPLQAATAADVSFLDNPRYGALLATTRAGAVILHPDAVDRLPQGCIGLLSREPYLAWAQVCALFHPRPAVKPGRHPSAVVDGTASVDPSAEIGALVVVGAGAVIGAGCRLEPHVTVADGVVLGRDCMIGSGASLSHAIVGDRVRLLPGARIGQRGFGFAPDGVGGYVSIPQLGRVVIEDDVEVGANTTIDRGSMRDTVIGAGSRLDNLVQIGHNVRLGRGCVIVSQAGISGSTILEDHVMVAGQAGLTGHLTIGREARIGAQAGVMTDVVAGESMMGSPCQPARKYFRELATLRRLASDAKPAPSRTRG